MTIKATVLADSVSDHGPRVTTFELYYPKFIHGENKTHRLHRMGDSLVDIMGEVGLMDDPNISRNASSSRAIPVKRLIEAVKADPVMPMYWGKNQSGMQAAEELSGVERQLAEDEWSNAMYSAICHAEKMAAAGAHKQIVNRIIEPYCHIKVVATATKWDNFFALRRHPAAQPEIRALADTMWVAKTSSTPKRLVHGQWHLPYIDRTVEGGITQYLSQVSPRLPGEDGVTFERRRLAEWNTLAIKVSVARCARTSYTLHDGTEPNVQQDLDLYDMLATSVPMHASPMEHQCTPDQWNRGIYSVTQPGWANPRQHGNLGGFIQYRKTLPGECVLEYRPAS